MAVSFNEMPSAYRVPGTYVEVDGSNALGAQVPEPQRILIIGYRSTTGTATQGVIFPVVGPSGGDGPAGADSQLAEMLRKFKRLNNSARVYGMGLDEAGGSAAASGSFTFTGTVTRETSLTVRIADVRVSTLVAVNTAAAAVAAQLQTAIAGASRLPMTSSVTTNVVTLTARHKGTAGNELTIAVEALPPGLTVATVQPSGGATDPDMNLAVTALDEDTYDTIVTGIASASAMLILEAEIARRWGPLVKQPGMVLAGKAGTHGQLTTYGDTRNSQFSTVIGSGKSPTPPWVWAAQAAARDAQRNDTMNPNRPRHGLTLPDCEAPAKVDMFDAAQRNLLLFDGISTFKTDKSGRVTIERLITTYQLNAAGQPDATYLAIETQRNLSRLYHEVLTLGSKYADYLLAPDGKDPPDQGVPMVTPKLFRGELIALNDSWIRRGLTKDATGFANALIVEINELDPERLDVNMAPRLVGGLVTLPVKISFQL